MPGVHFSSSSQAIRRKLTRTELKLWIVINYTLIFTVGGKEKFYKPFLKAKSNISGEDGFGDLGFHLLT